MNKHSLRVLLTGVFTLLIGLFTAFVPYGPQIIIGAVVGWNIGTNMGKFVDFLIDFFERD